MRTIQTPEEPSKGKDEEEELRRRVVSYARRLMFRTSWRVGDRDLEADDLAQEAFLRLWQAETQGKLILNRESWLYSVTRNIWIDRQRSQLLGRMTGLPEAGSGEEPLDPSSSPEALVIEGEMKELLRRAIDDLPARQREVELKYLEGLTPQEIADWLGSNPGAVRTNLSKAQSRLQTLLLGAMGASTRHQKR